MPDEVHTSATLLPETETKLPTEVLGWRNRKEQIPAAATTMPMPMMLMLMPMMMMMMGEAL